MSVIMYCPACAAPLTVRVGPCVVRQPDGSTLTALTSFLTCTACPLVSHVNDDGVLIDVGRVTTADIQEPIVPGVDAPVLFAIERPHQLRGRDS